MMTSSSEQNIPLKLYIESETSTLSVTGKSKLNCRIDVINVILELQVEKENTYNFKTLILLFKKRQTAL